MRKKIPKEWMYILNKANANSTSSIFSKRTYAVYKVCLNSPMITGFLI